MLRRMDGSLARLRRLLGAGRRATLAGAGGPWVLEAVQAGLAPPCSGVRALCMDTPHGPLAMAPARPLLRMLTGIDLPDDRDDGTDPLGDLAFDLALQALPVGWRALFQASCLLADDGSDGAFEVALRVRPGDSPLALATGLRGSADALAAALSGPGWQRLAPAQPPLPDDWRWRAPLCVGRTQLDARALLALQLGDVLLVAEPLFDLQGEGSVVIGGRRARCRFEMESRSLGNQTSLEFTEWDLTTDPTMDTDIDTQTDHDHDAPPDDADEDSDERDHHLDRLPVDLRFEVGRLEISLRELRALAPGGVIAVAGGGVAEVRIRAGGRVIGRGELVEVDGRLGVEITRLGALD
jgi:type III secretion protein Q